MKNYLCALAAMLLSFTYAEASMTKRQKDLHHRIYIGPDIFFDHAKAKYSFREANVDVTSNAVFRGLRIGYDYLKPRGFYCGTDGLIAIGTSWLRNRSSYRSGSDLYRINKKFNNSPLFANVEQRVGYVFQSSLLARSTLTPFGGVGWYYTKPQYDNDAFSSHWFYGAVGLRVAQQFCDYFNIGFNIKAMYVFAGKTRAMIWSKTVKEKIQNVWGYEVALPLTWYFEESKKWDLQLQPYLLKLDTNSLSQILGIRLQVGCNF